MPDHLKQREWTPHVWEGCRFFAWIRLLAKYRLKFHWPKFYVVVIATCVSFCHSVLWLVQQIFLSHKLRRVRLRHAPVFIVGHWRAGTTLLHELLIRDPRHAYPNTYQCMDPNHFLLTEWLMKTVFPFLMPSRRPMDNMPAGWDRPQEDEFALCMMGQPSPYLHLAFPNEPPIDQEYLDFKGVRPAKIAAWKREFFRFVQQLTFRYGGRRLILKSPPHSARIPVLLSLFPDARFIHIVRDPYVVFPSTVNMWKALTTAHGLQRPTFAGLSDAVLRMFVRLYAALDAGRKLVAPNRYHEVRYEDLVRDPIGRLEEMYRQLDLGDFDTARPLVRDYLDSVKNYETNRYELTAEEREQVFQHWGPIIRRYGYDAGASPAVIRNGVTHSHLERPLAASTV